MGLINAQNWSFYILIGYPALTGTIVDFSGAMRQWDDLHIMTAFVSFEKSSLIGVNKENQRANHADPQGMLFGWFLGKNTGVA